VPLRFEECRPEPEPCPGWSPRMGVTTMGVSLHRGVGGRARLRVGALCAVWAANQTPTRITVHPTPAEGWMQATPVATSIAPSAYRAKVVGADLIDLSVALVRPSEHGPKGAFTPRRSSIGLPLIDARPSVTAQPASPVLTPLVGGSAGSVWALRPIHAHGCGDDHARHEQRKPGTQLRL
jgi:hypothetical protein